MSDFVVVSVDGLDKILAKLAKLPDAVADDGVDAANKVLLDVLRAYPPYNHVSRQAAYGKTWANDRQRIAVMAKLREQGDIVNGVYTPRSHRTQNVSKSWKTVGTGRLSFLANEVPYASYLVGDEQANQPRMVGWKKVSVTLKEHTARLVRAFDAAVKKAIRRLGLS